MEVTIIGDAHGKIGRYKEIVDNCGFSICVGDFGFKKEWDWYLNTIDLTHHFINSGNHDYGPYMSDKTKSLGNFSYFEKLGIFTVRGAFSIDKIHRTEGLDWFSNEELTYNEGLQCFDEYVKLKPNIVVSHDCPHSVRKELFGINEKSNTSNLLQAMFEQHQPELWVFGHHHMHQYQVINKTQFICLEELNTIKI